MDYSGGPRRSLRPCAGYRATLREGVLLRAARAYRRGDLYFKALPQSCASAPLLVLFLADCHVGFVAGVLATNERERWLLMRACHGQSLAAGASPGAVSGRALSVTPEPRLEMVWPAHSFRKLDWCHKPRA